MSRNHFGLNMENKQSSATTVFWFMGAVLLLAALSRVLPHPPNVSPIAAMALLGGAYLGQRRWALLLPLACMVCSDLVLELMFRAGWRPYTGFHDTLPYVYGSLLLTAWLGTSLQRRLSPLSIVATSMAASVIFFVITNLGVWWQWMPHTYDSLVQCYVQAIPFFRNTALGDMAYTAAFFGVVQWVRSRYPHWAWAA